MRGALVAVVAVASAVALFGVRRRWPRRWDVRRRCEAENEGLRAVREVEALPTPCEPNRAKALVRVADLRRIRVSLACVADDPSVAKADAEPLQEARDRGAQAMGAEAEPLQLAGLVRAVDVVALAALTPSLLKVPLRLPRLHVAGREAGEANEGAPAVLVPTALDGATPYVKRGKWQDEELVIERLTIYVLDCRAQSIRPKQKHYMEWRKGRKDFPASSTLNRQDCGFAEWIALVEERLLQEKKAA